MKWIINGGLPNVQRRSLAVHWQFPAVDLFGRFLGNKSGRSICHLWQVPMAGSSGRSLWQVPLAGPSSIGMLLCQVPLSGASVRYLCQVPLSSPSVRGTVRSLWQVPLASSFCKCHKNYHFSFDLIYFYFFHVGKICRWNGCLSIK